MKIKTEQYQYKIFLKNGKNKVIIKLITVQLSICQNISSTTIWKRNKKDRNNDNSTVIENAEILIQNLKMKRGMQHVTEKFI